MKDSSVSNLFEKKTETLSKLYCFTTSPNYILFQFQQVEVILFDWKVKLLINKQAFLLEFEKDPLSTTLDPQLEKKELIFVRIIEKII